MSGFEVVGVVLGALPLLVSGLEHYAEGVATLKSMRDYQAVLETLIVSFTTSLAIYRSSCEELLSPLMLQEEVFYKLLDNPQQGWDDPDLGVQLAKRLGSSYAPYKSAVKLLKKRIDLLARKLYLDEKYKPTWTKSDGTADTNAREAFLLTTFRRVKIGFRADKYAQLMGEVDRDISKISELTRSQIALEPLRQERKRKFTSAFWLSIRDRARGVYDVLEEQWTSCCSCGGPHKAHLRLERRKAKEPDVGDVRFRLLISSDINSEVSKSLQRGWRTVEFEPFAVNDEPQDSTTPHLPAGRPVPVKPKAVAFKAPTPHPVFTLSLASAGSVEAPGRKPSPDAQKLDNLCQALVREPGQTSVCVGYLKDEAARLEHYVFVIPSTLPQTKAQKIVSLEDLLYQTTSGPLSTKERYTVAYTLASAVLQLHATPWLDKSWKLNDIHFVQNDADSTPLEEAYVMQSFDTAVATRPAKRLSSRQLVQNEMIFALGVALLELSFERPLRAFTSPEDLNEDGSPDALTEYSVAQRLATKIEARELPNYSSAAIRCIRLNFDTTSTSLENTEFRQLFHQGVVAPLQELYEYATAA